MRSRFRPIVFENVEKSKPSGDQQTAAVSANVVKPIAISPKANSDSCKLHDPLHDTSPVTANLFKPFSPLSISKVSLREHNSNTSFNHQDGSFHSQKPGPEEQGHAAELPHMPQRKGISIASPSQHLYLSSYNSEASASSSSEDGYPPNLETRRPESGDSQKQVDIQRIGNLDADESNEPVETVTSALGSSNQLSSSQSKSKSDEVTGHVGISSEGHLELKPQTSASDLPKSTETIRNANEEPKFSISSDGEECQVEGQEGTQRTDSTDDCPSPTVSPQSTNGDAEKEFESQPHEKQYKNGSGNRLPLARPNGGQTETADSDDDENPWFRMQSSSGGDEDEHEEETNTSTSEEVEKRKSRTEGKKKVSRLRRLFRSTRRSETGSQGSSLDSSSEELSLKESISDDSSDPADEPHTDRDASEEHLEQVLFLAISGKQTLDEVVDALLGVSTRPCDRVMKLLAKYMSSSIAIDSAFGVILEHEHSKRAEIPMKSIAPSHARYSPPREALVNLFSKGPQRLKKALLNHNKAKSEIFRFFTDEKPKRDSEIAHWISTATSLARILNGLLEHYPTEISEYIGGKKGLLHLMTKNHIHVPEVVEFIIQLSAANALSKSTGEELRYGAANAIGLVTLAKEDICDLLVEIFKKSCVATAQGRSHLLEWQTQVMSTQCLRELSKRAISIPRFTRDNCSYSGRHIKMLNSSLDELSLYNHDNRILSLLNAGFDAVLDGPEIENPRERSERNNPLVCVLGLVTELLETVHVAAGSKLAVTRKTVGSTNTSKIEKHVVSKMVRLCKLLHRRTASEVSYRAKMAIVNVFRCLSSSTVESTRAAMVKSQIPDRLMVLIRENQEYSVLHSCVLKCFSACLNNAQSIELHNEWLRALGRSEGWLQIMYEYFHKAKGWENHGRLPSFSTYVAIGLRLVDFSQNDKETKLQAMVTSKNELQTYVESIEAGLVKMRKEYECPCGGPKPDERAVSVLANAETLASKLDDYNAV